MNKKSSIVLVDHIYIRTLSIDNEVWTVNNVHNGVKKVSGNNVQDISGEVYLKIENLDMVVSETVVGLLNKVILKEITVIWILTDLP